MLAPQHARPNTARIAAGQQLVRLRVVQRQRVRVDVDAVVVADVDDRVVDDGEVVYFLNPLGRLVGIVRDEVGIMSLPLIASFMYQNEAKVRELAARAVADGFIRETKPGSDRYRRVEL